MNKARFFLIIFIILITVGIPAAIIGLRYKSLPTASLTPSSKLSFTTNNQTVNVDDSINETIVLDPGTNAVSGLKLEIIYDSSKLAKGFGISPNTTVFPVTVQGPIYDQCNGNKCAMSIVLSAGTDITKAITSPTQVATINFRAVAPSNNSTSTIAFGPASQAYSSTDSDSSTQNVLLSPTQTSMITINSNTALAATPTPSSTLPVKAVAAAATDSMMADPTATPTANAATKSAMMGTGPNSNLLIAGLAGFSLLILGAILVLAL